MGAGELASMNTGLRTAAANRAAVRRLVRRIARAQRGERPTKSVRVAIVVAPFVALLAAALLVGRAVIDQVLHTVLAARDGQGGRSRLLDARRIVLPAVVVRQETAALSEGRRRAMSGQPPQSARARRPELCLGRPIDGALRAFLSLFCGLEAAASVRTIDGRPTRR